MKIEYRRKRGARRTWRPARGPLYHVADLADARRLLKLARRHLRAYEWRLAQ